MHKPDTRQLAEALRRLILLALCRRNGLIEGADTNRLLREACGLAMSEAANGAILRVIHTMEQSKFINCRQNEGGTLLSIALTVTPNESMQVALAATEAVDRSVVSTTNDDLLWLCENDSRHAMTVVRCLRGYQAIRAIAAISDYNEEGHVALNVRGALLAVGIHKLLSREVKYYLRELGLVRSIRACNINPEETLWWWEVSSEPLSISKLMGLITGPDAFEPSKRYTFSDDD